MINGSWYLGIFVALIGVSTFRITFVGIIEPHRQTDPCHRLASAAFWVSIKGLAHETTSFLWIALLGYITILVRTLRDTTGFNLCIFTGSLLPI